jgi:ribosome biogenesis GTPase A
MRNPSLNENSTLVNKFNFSPDSELNFLANISPILSKMSTGPNTLSLENSDISNMEAFLNQNLINFEDILKLIVIGDKNVGKSLFINRFISDVTDDAEGSIYKYTPTER